MTVLTKFFVCLFVLYSKSMHTMYNIVLLQVNTARNSLSWWSLEIWSLWVLLVFFVLFFLEISEHIWMKRRTEV